MAEVPDGPPLLFTWRRVRRRVARAAGPERIEPEWWAGAGGRDETVRDYYRIEDADGRRYWLYRAGLYGEAGAGTGHLAPLVRPRALWLTVRTSPTPSCRR